MRTVITVPCDDGVVLCIGFDLGRLQGPLAFEQGNEMTSKQDLDDVHEVHADIPHQIEQGYESKRALTIHS